MTRRVVAVLTALLSGLLLGGGPGTLALLSDTDTVSAGQFSTGQIVPPSAPTVTTTSLLGGRRITWSATTVDTGTPAPAPVTGYRVLRYTGQTGGTGTEVCATTGSAPTTCDITGQPLVGFYSVQASFALQWTAEGPRGTALGDTTRPTITHVSPTNGQSTSANGLRNSVRDGCGEGPVACGTAVDDVAVTAVTWTMQRSSGALGATLECWNGSAWVARPPLGCAVQNAVVTTTGGVTTWRVPGNRNVAYPNNPAATITLTVTASDAAGPATSRITVTIT